jgi:hypothetical protein
MVLKRWKALTKRSTTHLRFRLSHNFFHSLLSQSLERPDPFGFAEGQVRRWKEWELLPRYCAAGAHNPLNRPRAAQQTHR